MNPALLAQLLQQMGALPSRPQNLAAPGMVDTSPLRVPTMRAEDPDFLQESLGPLNQEQGQLQRQMAQAEALMQGSGRRAATPLGAAIGGLADVAGAFLGANRQENLRRQQRGLDLRRDEMVAQAGRGPSASAAQMEQGRNERLLRKTLQGDAQAFQAEQQAEELAARAKEGRLTRALQRELEGARGKRAAKEAEADAVKQRFKIEADLRNEFQKLPPAVKAEQVVTAQRQLMSAKPNGVGDLQRIFAFVNIIDPGVAVKQEDVINVGKTGGLPGQAQAYFNQLTAQGTLSDAVRKQMEEAGRSIAQAKLKSYNAVRSTYEGLATQYGVDPARAVPNIGLSLDDAPAATPAPTLGSATPPQTTIVPQDFMKDIASKVTAGGVDYYQHKDGRIFTKDAQGNFVDVTPQD